MADERVLKVLDDSGYRTVLFVLYLLYSPIVLTIGFVKSLSLMHKTTLCFRLLAVS